MTNDQTPDALQVSAFIDLRTWINKPHLFSRRDPTQTSEMSVCEIAETLWNVYMVRTMLYKDFDEFLGECVRKVQQAHIRAAQAAKGAR